MVLPIPHNTPIFEARIDGAANVVKLLNSILFQDKPVCLFRITPNSIRATTEPSKVMQATAIIPKTLFSSYVLNSPGDEIIIKIDLRNLIHCIGLFVKEQSEDEILLAPELDTHFALGFRLSDESHELEVIIQSAGVETNCKIAVLGTTLGFDPFPEISPQMTVSKLEMLIDLLADIWQMFDTTSEYLDVQVTKKSFTFKMQSVIGSTAIEVDAHHEGVSQYTCDLRPGQVQNSSYRLMLMKKTLRPLSISSSVILKTSTEGFFSIKYSISIEDHLAFVEYALRSLDINAGDGINENSAF